jgi:ABC-type lipoprotein export system ATPase subunit
VPTLTALENITLPMDIAGRKPNQVAGHRDRHGRSARPSATVSELSGGQQQRTAAARAPASQPEIIFADEPTGNLDSRAGARCSVSCAARYGDGQTVVMVSHDPVAASYADRVVFLADGRIVDEIGRPDRRARARPHEAVRGARPA